jgi:putative ABC transport system permease protein
MRSATLLRRSLTYHRRSHLWVILGSALGTAILVGALVVGDSIRHSLRQIVFHRLGRAEIALVSQDRFFRAQVAEDMEEVLGTSVAALLQAQGTASAQGGRARVNNVQVVGVDAGFGEIGGATNLYEALAADQAIINQRLAARLALQAGDELVVRIENLDAMPRDAPLALDSEATIARRLRIKAVASDSDFGRFDLKADQVAPLTAFMARESLAQLLGLDQKANVLLIAERQDSPIGLAEAEAAFSEIWTLADAGLSLEQPEGSRFVELTSSRIFIKPEVVEAAQTLAPEAGSVLTYFVNEILGGSGSTPYSFVCGSGLPLTPAGMTDSEILINSWLAEDLQAGPGDSIQLSYFVLGSNRNLVVQSSRFSVRDVVPLTGMYADPDLLPDFPGLAEIENTRDWRPGIPIDLDLVRDKDEEYWRTHRGTPKAFMTLAAARNLWANRFGNATAVRFPGGDAEDWEIRLKMALDPGTLGFLFRPVKQEGLLASTQGVDFGQLFLGLSFFIIAAALLLTGLLFVFNVEKRAQESGLLLALGFPRPAVRRIILKEGAVLVVLGGILGCAAGWAYNLIVLAALKTVWKDIVGTSALQWYVHPGTLFLGTVAGMGTAFFTIWLVARKVVKQPIAGLQRGLTRIDPLRTRRPRISLWIGFLSAGAVALLLVTADFDRGRGALAVFFSAGALLLIGSMALANLALYRLGKKPNKERMSLFRIGVRGNARRRIRSLALIGLLASGLFIVFTVGANRQNAALDARDRASGTGGFALFGESAVPVLYDLNSVEGARFYGLDSLGDRNLQFVPFRVKPGDDASCLNLNRVSHPQLLGVAREELSRRRAFSFVTLADEVDPENPWAALDGPLPDGSIPAVADNTVIVWGLGKKVGDAITYQDEKGESFTVTLVAGLANSVFQGNVIISEDVFMRRFPSLSGYRMFLIDAPFENLTDVSRDMSWAMQDLGMELTPASTRLAEFNQVENTYLSIFLILGSLGLALGSLGIGIVVSRNLKERQGELALLRAVGFSRGSIQTLILSEHLTLLAAGILLGLAAALLATLPSLLAPGSNIPYLTILILLLLVLLNGVIWTYSATRQGMKGGLLQALRRE